MAIIAERAVEDRDHHETVYDFSFPFIGDPAAVSAVGHHAPTAAAAMAYKCPGRYIFEGGLDPLPLIKFWPYWQDEFWEVVFSIHRLFLSLPYQEAAIDLEGKGACGAGPFPPVNLVDYHDKTATACWQARI